MSAGASADRVGIECRSGGLFLLGSWFTASRIPAPRKNAELHGSPQSGERWFEWIGLCAIARAGTPGNPRQLLSGMFFQAGARTDRHLPDHGGRLVLNCPPSRVPWPSSTTVPAVQVSDLSYRLDAV